MKPLLLLPLILLLGSACKTETKETSGIHNLDLAAMKDNPAETGLSKLARQITYIPLETSPGVLLGSIRYCVAKDWIYALSVKDQRVYLFDRNGRFVRNIGALGKGPGEYSGAQDIQISPDGKLVYLYSTRTGTCSVYRVTGEPHSQFQMAFTSWRYARLSSGKHLMIAPYGDFTFTGEGQFLYYLQDSTGKVIRKYPSGNIILMGGNFGIGQFFVNPETVLTWLQYTDTVFQVDSNGDMSPKYALNFGKYRIPNEAHADISVLMQEKYRYIADLSLVETGPWLFLRYALQNGFHVGLYDNDHHPIQPILNTKGLIINDLDGGPDFFPASSDGKNEVYSMLQPLDLLLQKKEGAFDDKTYSKNDAHKSFLNFMGTLKEDDNPVIVVVTLKT